MSIAALRSGITAIATTTVAVVAIGCGGSNGSRAESSPEAGRFVSLGCASCHTLEAADARGRTGPNLDVLRPDAARVERQMRNGGDGMPSFKDKLSGSELRSLAAWVAKAAGES